MSKIPSEKLHRLVHAMSASEKRYFRLFVSGKAARSSKYLQLFELLAAQPVSDEAALQSAIYQAQRVEGKKYSELKAYLYQLLLKSLQAFDEQQSAQYRLNQLLQNVAALYKRGLYDDCLDQLHKAARIARQYEEFPQQIEIVRWSKQLAYTRMDVDFLHKNLGQLEYEEAQALEQLNNLAGYRSAFFQLYTVNRQEAAQRSEQRQGQLRQIIGQEAFGSPDLATSHKARVMYYRTLNIYHYAMRDYARFHETGLQLMALLESQPHFLAENLADYIATLSNLILSCGLLGRYAEVRDFLQKMRDLKPITADDRRKIHRQYFVNLFALCTFTGDFETARQEMGRCQREAELLAPQDYETASFYFYYCTICFGCGDFDAALDYLNQWLGQPRSVEREDLQSLARVLSMILHYEMGNLLLLESLARSATRFMRKKNRFQQLERRFLRFMADLVRKAGTHEEPAVFLRLKRDLPGLPGLQTLLQTFDLEAWIDSKIEGRTFAAVVRRKWENRA